MSTTYRTAVFIGGVIALFTMVFFGAALARAQLLDDDDAATTTDTATTSIPGTDEPAEPEPATSTTTPQNDVPEVGGESIEDLRARISELEAENARLRAQLSATQSIGTSIDDLTRLEEGDSGEAVSELQTLLSEMGSIYPEGLVTGYYGPLTEAAVTRFQTQQGLPATGIADAETIVELLRAAQMGSVPPPPAPGTTSGSSDGVGATGGITLCHIEGGDTGSAQTITVGTAELQTHLGHGDAPFPCENIDFDAVEEELQNLREQSDDSATSTDSDIDADDNDNDNDSDDEDETSTSTESGDLDDDDETATSTDDI